MHGGSESRFAVLKKTRTSASRSRTKPPGPPADIRAQVARALAEDVGSGDITAKLLAASRSATATVITREGAVLCGQAWFTEVFRQLDARVSIQWRSAEGAVLAADALICELGGKARSLLTGERTALNFLQTLSATATRARAYVDAVKGTGVQILDTRKTIPGLRAAQKYAVRIGGAVNHRFGLFDAILIKENHIMATGTIIQAVREARRRNPGVLLEVEVENLGQADEAFVAGADRLLLDNFPLQRIYEAVRMRRDKAPKTTLEASGGITLANIRAVAETGVDFISIGDMTKNLHAVDLSMRFRIADRMQ